MNTVLSDDLEREIKRLPARKRRALTLTLDRLVLALVSEDTETLEAFVEPEAERGKGDVRARNVARLELLGEEVRGESLPGRELGAQLGISRQRLQQLRESGRLLALKPPLRSEFWYPRWQFDASGAVRGVVPDLLAAAQRAHLSPLSLHLLLTSRDVGIEGTPLVDLLDEQPDDVVAIVGAASEISS